MKSHIAAGAILAALALPAAAHAEIAVSANDGKQMRAGDTVNGPEPDSISVLNITNGKVRLLGSVAAPAAMIGPPASVAVSKDGKFAIVTACQKFEGKELVLDDLVSVVDLSVPNNPRVIQTVHAGPGASGVSISPNGKLALVASTGDDSVTAFSINGKTLTPVGKVQLDAKSGPTDVVFTRDGKSAIAIGRGNSKLMMLSVNGNTVTSAGREFASGRSPYGAVVTLDGKYVINTNLGGALPPAAGALPAPRPAGTERRAGGPAGGGGGMSRQGTVAMTDIKTGNVVASVVVGPTPEHVVLSSDGKYIAVVVANGTASVRSDPKFDQVLGLLEVYAVGDGTLTPAARADTGHWCQGATFSKDDHTILLQCAAEREIEVFHLEGNSLTQDKDATIPMGARPGAIATASSR